MIRVVIADDLALGPVIALTMFEPDYVSEALRSGAGGLLVRRLAW